MQPITETYANGLTRTYTPINCTTCGTATDPLAMFPKDLCLECYKETAEANRTISARELAQMWGTK